MEKRKQFYKAQKTVA